MARQAAAGPLAYRIAEWDQRYEVNADGGGWKRGQRHRVSPLEYVRWRAWGLVQGEGYRELLAATGPMRACRCFGLFAKLVEVAASRAGGERGWLLSGRAVTLGPEELAGKLGFDADQVREDLHTLIYKVRWLEIAACSFAQAGTEAVADIVKVDKLGKGCEVSPSDPGAFKNRNRNVKSEEENFVSAKGNVRPGDTEEQILQELSTRAGGSRLVEANRAGEASRGREHGREVAKMGAQKAETDPPGGEGGRAEETKGSLGVGPEWREANSERRGEQRSGPDGPNAKSERRAARGEQRTGADAERGAKGPISRVPQGQGDLWQWDIGGIDADHDDPRLIMRGVHETERIAREQVIDRALQWFEVLLPQLAENPAASDASQERARKDVRCIENRLLAAWETGGGEYVAKLLGEMQEICGNLKKRRNRGRAENNPMKIWVANCKRRYGINPSMPDYVRARGP